MTANTTKTNYQQPAGWEIDFNLLREFEDGLDPIDLQKSRVPCHVLGYGEISTVFEILTEKLQGLAFKRLSIFNSFDEIERYLETYLVYNHLLPDEVGIRLPPHGHAAFINQAGQPIFYIIQQKMPAPAMGNKAIHLLPQEQVLVLVRLILQELFKVWQFNHQQTQRQIGIDGQISNWVIENFDGQHPHLNEKASFLYLDTSTPFIRIQSIEQLDAELFLRSAPSFLVWILRLFFLKEVMNRYYDFRKVAIDLLANFYKEQKEELIADLVTTVNEFISAQALLSDLAPLQEKEIRDYYREDALIWSLYLSMRRFDRFLHRFILHHPYRYILPGRIKR